MKKRTTTKGSPTSDERETRPVSKWRLQEYVTLANEVGLETKNKKKPQLKAELEEMKKNGKISSQQLPDIGEQGGAREGAGRKTIGQEERAETFQEFARSHSEQEVTHTWLNSNGQTVTETKSRNEFLLDRLYEMGFKDKQIKAVQLYFDRSHGKAIQPMHHSGQIGSPDQRVEEQQDIALQKAIEAYEQHS